MTGKQIMALMAITCALWTGCRVADDVSAAGQDREGATMSDTNSIRKSDAEWKRTLTAEQYRVLRQKGTERPFSGKYDAHHERGSYSCAGCGQQLFRSNAKFDSGCGWPSYFDPASTNSGREHEDAPPFRGELPREARERPADATVLDPGLPGVAVGRREVG